MEETGQINSLCNSIYLSTVTGRVNLVPYTSVVRKRFLWSRSEQYKIIILKKQDCNLSLVEMPLLFLVY